jgi:hypothetical protein
MPLATCVATAFEQRRPLPVDALVPDPLFTSTHAITIDAPPGRVLAVDRQMAAGRGGWYSLAGFDRAVRIVGGLLFTYAFLGLLWPFAAMHQREVLAAVGGGGDG